MQDVWVYQGKELKVFASPKRRKSGLTKTIRKELPSSVRLRASSSSHCLALRRVVE